MGNDMTNDALERNADRRRWQQRIAELESDLAELRAARSAAVPALPDVSDLLTLAVECRLIRINQLMDCDVQAALEAFAKRLLG